MSGPLISREIRGLFYADKKGLTAGSADGECGALLVCLWA